MTENEFAIEYKELVELILNNGEFMKNKRTDSGIAFLPDGYSFSLNLINNVLPTCGMRRSRPHIPAAEVAWCLMGSTSVGWLNRHTKIWNAFADNNGDVMEAYGYRWRHAFHVDQIQLAIDRLKKDPTDRRIWVTSYHPEDLVDKGQKTVPCPVGFTLSSYNDRINSTIMIRSSDVFIGLPIDVMRHALIMRAVANSVNMELGYMRVALAHPHLYQNQWDMCEEMLKQDIEIPQLKMPESPWDVGHISKNSEAYVGMIKESAAFFAWPSYDPKVRVVK